MSPGIPEVYGARRIGSDVDMQCRECGRPLSTRDKVCLGCGTRWPTKRGAQRYLLAWTVTLGSLVALVIMVFG